MLQSTNSYALDCCECGAVVGTEGPQRGTLLLPCQHVLHMGCVEFIKRRGKLLMGMDSTDVAQDEAGEIGGASSSVGNGGDSSTANWTRQMHDRCLCPACGTLIRHFIPLYLRSEDDPGATSKSKTSSSAATTVANATVENDFTRVHAAQKRVLLRLRGLCEQRRRMTELTHTCAALHEQRARYLAEVQKEERCFPGLISGTEKDGDAHTTPTASPSDGRGASSALSGLPLEHMGITELELYMAQATPRLLRTQAEVRKERHLVERRTKKLNALRSHYHSSKELHALDAEIAERQAQAHARVGPGRASSHSHSSAAVTGQTEVLQNRPAVAAESAHPPLQHPQQQQPEQPQPPQELLLQPPPVGAVVLTPSPTSVCLPARKKMRGEAAIDVDDVLPTEVVEVLSGEVSETDEPEVMVIDEDDGEDGSSGGAEFVERGDDSAEEASSYEGSFLIPCYVRTSTSSSSVTEPKTPHRPLTHHHVRMLPRREDRLWQPSLQF